MRTAGLSLFAGLTALHAITVTGDVICNTKLYPTETPTISPHKFQDDLWSQISALCQTPPGEVGAISKQLGGLVLQLHRGEVVQDVAECQRAFAAIISQCVEARGASGGQSHAHARKNITYIVLPSNSDDQSNGSNYAQAPARSLKYGSRNSKQAMGQPGNGVPVEGKPIGKMPPGKSPVPTKPTETATHTKIIVGPTRSCKELALFMQKPSLRREKTARKLDETRNGFVGSRVDVNNRRGLSKRVDDGDDWYNPTGEDTGRNHRASPKTGSACGMVFEALPYPKAASMPPKALYYSIDSPDGFCETIKFQETTTAILGADKYHIEHILEWQTVTKFFDWMDRKKIAEKKTYSNPDPTNNLKGELSFCQYWKEQWSGSYQQDFTIDGKTQKPMKHLIQAFPGVANREEEFVWLQASINTPAKSNMWSYKGLKDNAGTLHNEEKMREHITGERKKTKGENLEKVAGDLVDSAKIALLKLKALLGARKYMRTSKVSNIFKKQKQEIGKMLEAIDDELPKNPRKPTRGSKTVAPWIKQNLGKYWTEYMNERFKIAHTRTHNDMDTYLKLLDDTWCDGRPKSKPGSPKPGSRPSTPDPIDNLEELFGAMDLNDVKIKDLCRFLDKVQKEWDTEKRIPWTAPW